MCIVMYFVIGRHMLCDGCVVIVDRCVVIGYKYIYVGCPFTVSWLTVLSRGIENSVINVSTVGIAVKVFIGQAW